MKSFCYKGIDYFFRNIPTVTKKIWPHWRNGQFFYDVLYNINFGNGFVVQNKRIVQDDAVTGKRDSNGLMPIILFSFKMGLMEIRIFNWMQSLWRRLCFWRYGIIHNAENSFSSTQCFWIIISMIECFKASSSSESSYFPLLRKWATVVLWQQLFLEKSVVLPWYPEIKILTRILMKWFMTRFE